MYTQKRFGRAGESFQPQIMTLFKVAVSIRFEKNKKFFFHELIILNVFNNLFVVEKGFVSRNHRRVIIQVTFVQLTS